MSLDWKSTGSKIQQLIEDSRKGSKKQLYYINVRDSVVWATLAVGFPGNKWELHEKTWEEFYARVHQWERCVGAYRTHEDGRPLYLTPQEVHWCVGLSTNAGNKSKAEWNRDMAWKWNEMAQRKLRIYHGKP